MPKLDKLIRELCSDGVKVFRLEEIAHYAKTRIDCKTINEDNYVGVENLLQNKAGKTKATSVPTTGMVIAYQKNDILIGNIRPYLRKVWLADCEGGTNGDVLTVQIEDTEKVIPQFLYYVLSSEKFFLYDIQNSKGAKMPRGSKDAVMKFEVPLPHLDVQREIVRMLDSYTESVVELQRQLTAELAARKTQYSFYRDKLLTFNTPVEWKPMEKEFPFIRNGFVGTVTPYFTSEEQGVRYLEGTNIHDGVISDNEIIYVSKEFHQKHIRNELKNGDILMVQSGHVGECAVVDDKYAGANCHALIIMSNAGHCNSRFVMHYLRSTEGKSKLKKITTGGTVKHILASNMKKFMIPVPPLDVQSRIVNVLDNFEKICSDLNIGLPAEIEARQKQYEYYRDKLLTFAETGNTILSRAEQSRAEQSRAEQSAD